MKNPSGKILTEYESRYYPLYKSDELGYWRVDQSKASKGYGAYGFNKICSSLFANDTLYIFLRINLDNKESV